ncbi:hypothetical protein ACOME3_004001 [Neoechinorhynchus agilis]
MTDFVKDNSIQKRQDSSSTLSKSPTSPPTSTTTDTRAEPPLDARIVRDAIDEVTQRLLRFSYRIENQVASAIASITPMINSMTSAIDEMRMECAMNRRRMQMIIEMQQTNDGDANRKVTNFNSICEGMTQKVSDLEQALSRLTLKADQTRPAMVQQFPMYGPPPMYRSLPPHQQPLNPNAYAQMMVRPQLHPQGMQSTFGSTGPSWQSMPPQQPPPPPTMFSPQQPQMFPPPPQPERGIPDIRGEKLPRRAAQVFCSKPESDDDDEDSEYDEEEAGEEDEESDGLSEPEQKQMNFKPASMFEKPLAKPEFIFGQGKKACQQSFDKNQKGILKESLKKDTPVISESKSIFGNSKPVNIFGAPIQVKPADKPTFQFNKEPSVSAIPKSPSIFDTNQDKAAKPFSAPQLAKAPESKFAFSFKPATDPKEPKSTVQQQTSSNDKQPTSCFGSLKFGDLPPASPKDKQTTTPSLFAGFASQPSSKSLNTPVFGSGSTTAGSTGNPFLDAQKQVSNFVGTDKGTKDTGIVFGSSLKQGDSKIGSSNLFASATSRSAEKVTPLFGNAPRGAANADNGRDSTEPANDAFSSSDYKPILSLPEKVDLSTGEEKHEILFKSDPCILYKFESADKAEWKECGRGSVSIGRDDKNRYRLIFRRDQVLKLAANHILDSSIKFIPRSNKPNCLCWYANDFAIDPEGQMATFCIRFKTATDPHKFVNACASAGAEVPTVPEVCDMK